METRDSAFSKSLVSTASAAFHRKLGKICLKIFATLKTVFNVGDMMS